MRGNRRRARIVSAESGALVASAEVADTPATRMVGLLGHSRLESGHALVLEPCGLIHTWFMRFPIDVLFVAGNGEVVRVYDNLQPFRFAWGTRRARRTIELPAGERRLARVAVGSVLRIEAA
jgi:hypothetical protein